MCHSITCFTFNKMTNGPGAAGRGFIGWASNCKGHDPLAVMRHSLVQNVKVERPILIGDGDWVVRRETNAL